MTSIKIAQDDYLNLLKIGPEKGKKYMVWRLRISMVKEDPQIEKMAFVVAVMGTRNAIIRKLTTWMRENTVLCRKAGLIFLTGVTL